MNDDFQISEPRSSFSPPPTSGYAIAALVLGIASIPACMCYGVPSIICGILALVFAHVASKDIDDGNAVGIGLARAGRICGIVGLVLSVLCWTAMVCFFAFAIKQAAHDVSHPPVVSHPTAGQPGHVVR